MRDGILQALSPSRCRQAKIDLFSSFAGWRLTNAAEEGRRGDEGERARDRIRLTGKNQFVVPTRDRMSSIVVRVLSRISICTSDVFTDARVSYGLPICYCHKI